MWPVEVQLEGLVDKKTAGSEPTPFCVATLLYAYA